MTTVRTDGVLLGAGIVTTGLMAGLLYGWSVSVIPGTRRLGHESYVGTMQHINRAIQNPAFLVPFLGVPVVLSAAALTQLRAGEPVRGALLAAAGGTYALGVVAVTIRCNVPLNDALDVFDLSTADEAAVSSRRRSYEPRWNRWHHVRTAASAVAFVLAAAAGAVGR